MTTATHTFPSIDAFYDADERRRPSPECDYGVWWSEPGRMFPRYRVSLVESTGEVYALNQSAGTVRVLGYVSGRAECDQLLNGWEDVPVVGGLGWVRQRLLARAVAE